MKISLNWSEERRRQISILLTILALLLWSQSILFAKFDIGHWGLIGSLPITFFVALALLTVASAILWASPPRPICGCRRGRRRTVTSPAIDSATKSPDARKPPAVESHP